MISQPQLSGLLSFKGGTQVRNWKWPLVCSSSVSGSGGIMCDTRAYLLMV